MADSFPNQNELTAQGHSWALLVPHDVNELAFMTKAIHNASDAACEFTAVGADGTPAPFYIPPGGILPIRTKRILATGLTVGAVLTGLNT